MHSSRTWTHPRWAPPPPHGMARTPPPTSRCPKAGSSALHSSQGGAPSWPVHTCAPGPPPSSPGKQHAILVPKAPGSCSVQTSWSTAQMPVEIDVRLIVCRNHALTSGDHSWSEHSHAPPCGAVSRRPPHSMLLPALSKEVANSYPHSVWYPTTSLMGVWFNYHKTTPQCPTREASMGCWRSALSTVPTCEV